MTQLPRMSHSRFTDYVSCGELYRLKRIERVPVTPSIYAIAGIAFHEWTDFYDVSPPWDTEVPHEQWYANRITELIAAAEEKSGFALREWDNPRRSADLNEKTRDDFIESIGPDMVAKYITWRANSAWSIADLNGTPGVEFELALPIGEVETIVKIDRVFERPEEGDLVAIDTKTWSRKRVTAQLPTYLVALRKAGFNVTGGAYYEARKGAATPIQDFTYWDEARLAALHEQAAHGIADRLFIPHPSDACRMCDVRRFCLWYLD